MARHHGFRMAQPVPMALEESLAAKPPDSWSPLLERFLISDPGAPGVPA